MQEAKTRAGDYLQRYWGILVLLLWGAALFGFEVLRLDRFGIEEGAARALILNWAVFDRVLNPLITLGIPDARALFFVPLGAYWSGSMLAAKVYTMLLAFIAVVLLYRWGREIAGRETALIASGLLLVFPLFLNQIDALAAGPYLLLAFTVGSWISAKHDAAPRPLGTWYFMLMIWVLITITIHPAALGYPLALAWHWQRRGEVDQARKKHLYAGLTLVVLITLATRGGWQTAHWLQNPLPVLGQAWQALSGVSGEPSMLVATILSLALLLIVWLDRRFLARDLLGSTLLVGIAAGLLAADTAWALLAVSLILYRGTYHLIQLNEALFSGGSLLRNRALVLFAFLLISTTSMTADKTRIQAVEAGKMSQQDELMNLIAMDVAGNRENTENLQIASQWPGRTMIATRLDTFQLPPDSDQSNEDFLASIKGITHLLFDPHAAGNKQLARRIAELGGATQTVDVNEEAVLVRIVTWDLEELVEPPDTTDSET